MVNMCTNQRRRLSVVEGPRETVRDPSPNGVTTPGTSSAWGTRRRKAAAFFPNRDTCCPQCAPSCSWAPCLCPCCAPQHSSSSPREWNLTQALKSFLVLSAIARSPGRESPSCAPFVKNGATGGAVTSTPARNTSDSPHGPVLGVLFPEPHRSAQPQAIALHSPALQATVLHWLHSHHH